MKFELTDMTKADLISLLEKDTNSSFASKTNAKLAREAYEALIPNNSTYPSIYLFTQLGRDHEYADFNNYVLVDDRDTGAQIYKAISSVTKEVYWGASDVLKELAQSWQGDVNSIMSELYGVSDAITPADTNQRNVSRWIKYNYRAGAKNARNGHYISKKSGEPIIHRFHETAQKFIDSAADIESYKFDENEEYLPDYCVVPAPTAEVLVPETKTLK